MNFLLNARDPLRHGWLLMIATRLWVASLVVVACTVVLSIHIPGNYLLP